VEGVVSTDRPTGERPNAPDVVVALDVRGLPTLEAAVVSAVEVRRRGHGLVVLGGARGATGSDLLSTLEPIAVAVLLDPDGDPAVAAARAAGVTPEQVVVAAPGPEVAARLSPFEPASHTASDGLQLDHGWSFTARGHDPAQVVTDGTAWMTGNGLLGYRGTPAEWGRDGFVACVLSDTYDTADGKWRELVNAPNALLARWSMGDRAVGVSALETPDADATIERRFDLRLGRSRRRLSLDLDGTAVTLEEERFAAMARLHLVVQRHVVTAPPGTRLRLETGIDGDVWQLNGEHLPRRQFAERDDVLLCEATTVESNVDVAVAQGWSLRGGRVEHAGVVVAERSMLRNLEVVVGEQGRVVLDLVMAAGSSNDDDLGPDVGADLVARAARAVAEGHEQLLVEQVAAWDEVWDRCDVRLDGDPLAQVALRFGIHHNVIATPRHSDRLPVGARGLSCQAYQGAAFWDQEAFNLPMFTWTDPSVARRLLTYRVRTLPGARRKAARLGYRGAFFAWISGDTGDELCPDFFFRDVLSGRWIRNHFNDWQMHIAPDVALAVRDYVAVTGDVGFLAEGGAELVFEVARFLASFVLRDEQGRDHLVRVLGPDEFHENVDDNAFSNHQSEAALRFALDVHARLGEHDPDGLAATVEAVGLAPAELDRWRDVADRIVLATPDEHGVIEAFDGFHALEDVRPADLVERLQHPDEYWGWPNGVAVHTQVSKQADVVQLFVAQPSRFPARVMAANVDHYLPRTSHKSSLSRSAHAIVLARLGRPAEARDFFVASAAVDLLADGDHAPGGTFIGGLRTAAAGVSWSVAVLGFAGLRVHAGELLVEPHLPRGWDRLAFALDLAGVRVRVSTTHEHVTVSVDADAPAPLRAVLEGTSVTVAPGESCTVVRQPSTSA
jgi:kojibiose phosphorylase